MKRSEKIKLAVVSIVSLLVVLFIWRDDLSAQWGFADDHEIMTFLGPEGSLRLSEIPRQLMATEVGRPGETMRYRPSYYALRLLETWAWGASPLRWYACRMLLAALTVALMWWVLQRHVGLVAGLGFTLAALTLHAWAGVFARLGTAEAYGAPALAVYAAAFDDLIGSRRGEASPARRATSWTCLTIAALVAMGSKENLLFLAPTTVFLLFKLRAIRDPLSVACTTVTCAYGAVIAYAIGKALLASRADVYSQDIASSARETTRQLLGIVTPTPKVIAIAGAALLLVGVAAYAVRRFAPGRLDALRSACLSFLTGSLLLIGLYVSQRLFYRGGWAPDTHYGFPGMLAFPLLLLLLVLFLERCLGVLTDSAVVRRAPMVVCVVGLGLFVVKDGFAWTRSVASRNMQVTRTVTASIDRVARVLKKDGDAALLLETHSVWAYEPIYSVGAFLRARAVRNRVFLRCDRMNPANSPLERNLESQLVAMSSGGNEAWHIERLSRLSDDEACYCITFFGSSCTERCRHILEIWPP